MESQQSKQQNVEIDISADNGQPLYADDVLVLAMVKQFQGENVRDGMVSLVFVDGLRKKGLARLILSRATAKSLAKVLNDSISKMDTDMRTASEVRIHATTQDQHYIG